MKKYPILILHGWNLSSEKFEPLIRQFEKRGYRVLCPDLPGFGNSARPKHSLHLSDYVKFVGDYLTKEETDKIILIGHSFGGRISIKLVAENSKFLKALILTGAPGIIPVPRSKVVFFIYLSKMGKMLFSLPFLSYFQDKARKLIYKLARANDYYNTDTNMRDTFKNIVKENLQQYLAQINTSTLLLWGENDGIVPLSIAYKMKNLIRHSKLAVIPNSRHGVPWTHPEEFANRVEEYLQNI